jgi:hypothetical protein
MIVSYNVHKFMVYKQPLKYNEIWQDKSNNNLHYQICNFMSTR